MFAAVLGLLKPVRAHAHTTLSFCCEARAALAPRRHGPRPASCGFRFPSPSSEDAPWLPQLEAIQVLERDAHQQLPLSLGGARALNFLLVFFPAAFVPSQAR